MIKVTLFSFRISQYCELCQMVTEEKNKYVTLRRIALQTITELRERVKLQENELGIKHTRVTISDRCVRLFCFRFSMNALV